MNNRERQIRKLISDSGLECSALRLAKSGHYKATVVSESGRAAQAMFSGTPSDRRGDLNKKSSLRHFAKTGVMRG